MSFALDDIYKVDERNNKARNPGLYLNGHPLCEEQRSKNYDMLTLINAMVML